MTHASPEEQVWQLFFDDALRTCPRGRIVVGVGVILVSPHNYVIPRAFSLTKPCSNSVVEYDTLLIGMQLAEKIGVKHLEAYGDSKLIVNQVRGEYEVRHEDLVPYHNATINMGEKFKSFYINQPCTTPISSPLHWLFQPERQRKYLFIAVTCTAQNSTLKAIRLKKEIFKLKRFLRLQHVRNSGIGDSHSLTSSYTTYCLTILKRQQQSKGKLLDSITTRSHKHCIADRLMESCFTALHIKRHMKHSGKLTMVCAELTNPDPSLETDIEDSVIISQR